MKHFRVEVTNLTSYFHFNDLSGGMNEKVASSCRRQDDVCIRLLWRRAVRRFHQPDWRQQNVLTRFLIFKYTLSVGWLRFVLCCYFPSLKSSSAFVCESWGPSTRVVEEVNETITSSRMFDPATRSIFVVFDRRWDQMERVEIKLHGQRSRTQFR